MRKYNILLRAFVLLFFLVWLLKRLTNTHDFSLTLAALCFFISAILFISVFGIYRNISKFEPNEKPSIFNRFPPLSAIPWISGFILSVISFSFISELHLLVIFFVNLVVVFIFGPNLTKGLLVRFSRGKGLEVDMMYALGGGIIIQIIGVIIRLMLE